MISFLGWIRKMLRDSRCRHRPSVCRQNCLQEVDDQAQPERENDSRDSDSQVIEPQKHCRIPQFLR